MPNLTILSLTHSNDTNILPPLESVNEHICRALPRAEDFYRSLGEYGHAPLSMIVEHVTTLISPCSVNLPGSAPLALYLHSIVEKIVSFEPLATKWDLTKATRFVLAKILIEHHGARKTLDHIYNPQLSLDDLTFGTWPTFEHELLTVAIAIDRLDIISKLLPHWHESGFKDGIFPSPIAVATSSPNRRTFFDSLLTREATLDYNNSFIFNTLCTLKARARRSAITADNTYALTQISRTCHFAPCCLTTTEPLHERLSAAIKRNSQPTLSALLATRQARHQGPQLTTTILDKAAYTGALTIATFAIESLHADPNDCLASTFDYPLTTAAKRGHGPVVRVLLSHGALVRGFVKTHPLIHAAGGGYVGVAAALMEFDGVIGRPYKSEVVTALAKASRKGHAAFVEMVLDRYWDKEKAKGAEIMRFLSDVRLRGHWGVVRVLMEKGVPAAKGEGVNGVNGANGMNGVVKAGEVEEEEEGDGDSMAVD